MSRCGGAWLRFFFFICRSVADYFGGGGICGIEAFEGKFGEGDVDGGAKHRGRGEEREAAQRSVEVKRNDDGVGGVRIERHFGEG